MDARLLEEPAVIDAKAGRVGTPLYLSPEVVRQLPYDYKVDTWAVGCCLYHIVALEPPFTGENIQSLGVKIVGEQPKPLPRQYSERLSTFIVDTLMQKEAAVRPYISQILRKPTKYFGLDAIKMYKELVFSKLKTQTSCVNELDFIYQVLISAGLFETTHSVSNHVEPP